MHGTFRGPAWIVGSPARRGEEPPHDGTEPLNVVDATGVAAGVAIFVALLAGALVVGVLASRVRLPYSVALVVAGLVVGIVAPRLAVARLDPSWLFVFLPALIFEGSWHLERNALRRVWPSIVVLAVPGVVLTTVLIAGAVAGVHQLPFHEALLLGAIVAATDPVAVIAVFRRLAVPLSVATIVEGESIANDGVAVVLYSLFVALATGASAPTPAMIAGKALAVTAGGIAVGAAAAHVMALLLRGSNDGALQAVGSVVVAYGSYVGAERLDVSGIFASATAAITLRALESFPSDEQAMADVERFWATLAFLANSLLFLLVGFSLQMDRITHEPVLIAVAVAAVVLARVVLAYLLVRIVPDPERRPGWHHLIALAGIRGGLPLALALGLPDNLAHRPQIIDAVFAVVFVTLVPQGVVVKPLLSRLRL